MKSHPCQSCGACCAYYRVSFHWLETLPESHAVPEILTQNISPHKIAMKGTNQQNPNCIALLGLIGKSTSCQIYTNRPSTCRSFNPSYEDGQKNINCEKARSSKGLSILTLNDWNF